VPSGIDPCTDLDRLVFDRGGRKIGAPVREQLLDLTGKHNCASRRAPPRSAPTSGISGTGASVAGAASPSLAAVIRRGGVPASHVHDHRTQVRRLRVDVHRNFDEIGIESFVGPLCGEARELRKRLRATKGLDVLVENLIRQ
jgi:hypothetical protein